MVETHEPERSGIREYAHVLWRRKLIIIITAAVAVLGVLAYCEISGKSYTATATVLLEPPISPLVTGASATNPAQSALVNVADQVQVIQSSTIENIVARTIPNPPSVTASQTGILATNDVVTLSVSDSNPQTAAAAANAYADAYIAHGRNITKQTFESAAAQIQSKVNTVQLAISNATSLIRSSPAGANLTVTEAQLGDLQNQLTTLENTLQQYQFYATQGTNTEVGEVITRATVPTHPSSPKTLEYVVLALIFGLILGIGLALLVNAVTTRE